MTPDLDALEAASKTANQYGYLPSKSVSPADFAALVAQARAAEALAGALKGAIMDLEQTLSWREESWECSEDELLGEYRAALAAYTAAIAPTQPETGK